MILVRADTTVLLYYCTTVPRENSDVVEHDSCHEACAIMSIVQFGACTSKKGQCRGKTMSSQRDVRAASLTAGINRTRGNQAGWLLYS